MKINCLYDKLVSTKELNPYKNNPNKHSDEQIKKLAYNIDKIRWRKPIIVSKLSNQIITGHGCTEAAKLNGWSEVPVNYQDFEDANEEYAYVVSDNSLQDYSELDLDLIRETLIELPDIDIELMALENIELMPEENINPQDHWNDMPEYEQKEEDKEIYAKIVFRFQTKTYLDDFSKLIGQNLNNGTNAYILILLLTLIMGVYI